MEPENLQFEERQNNMNSFLTKVTPLSRYLAFTLFTILPFIGGWVGYKYAPEKVVEVERVVIREVVKEAPVQIEDSFISLNFNQDLIVDAKTAKVGDKFGDFTVTAIKFYTSLTGEDSVDISFSGSGIISGRIYPAEMLGPGIAFDEASQNIFPAIWLNGEIKKATQADIVGPLVETLPKEAILYMGGTGPTYTITAELKDYRFRYEPMAAGPTAILAEVQELKRN